MAEGKGEGIEFDVRFSTDEAVKGLDDINSELDKSKNKVVSLKQALKTSFNVAALAAGVRVLKSIAVGYADCVKQAMDFNETVNKFVVSMGSAGDTATKFQNTLQEALGTSKTELMDYQSTFKNIMTATGELSDNTAEQISESLVKMALDYSSLFNVDQKSAMQKYEGAMTGSIRPIRSGAGYDISKNTVTETAKSLGVDKSYAELNEMEKRLLRIITLMNQMKNTNAPGDLAKTIESASNQVRVFKNQLQELQVWLGNVFMGTIGAILPYINGFIMALKEIVKTLAIFTGFTTGSSNMSDVFESAEVSSGGLASNVGTAAKSAKELRKQVMGFDKLNIINTNKSNSNGSGGSGGGGVGRIDPAILNAMKQYDNLMGKVRMKATDIRDKIMEWLGFMKQINPLTGEVEWKLKEGWTRLKAIQIILKAIAGLFALKGILSLIGGIVKFNNVMKGAIPATKNWQIGLKALASPITKLGDKLIPANVKSMLKWNDNVKLLNTGFWRFTSIAGGAVIAINGISNVAKICSNEVKTGEKNTKGLVLSFGELAGAGVLIGSSFGPLGMLIGGVAGILGGFITKAIATKTALNDLVESQLFGTLTITTDEWADALNRADTSVQNSKDNLKNFNTNMQDYFAAFNGAYDTVDKFATRFSTAAYKISNEDIASMDTAIKSFGDNAVKVVDTSTTEAYDLWAKTFAQGDGLLDESEQSYLAKIMQTGEDQKTTIKNAQDTITKTYKDGIATRGYLTDDERKTIENALNQIAELTQKHMEGSETDMQYYAETLKNNANRTGKDILNISEDSYKNFNKAAENYKKDVEKNVGDVYNTQMNYAKMQKDSEIKAAQDKLDRGEITNEQYQKDFDSANADYQKALDAAVNQRSDTIARGNEVVQGYMDKIYHGLEVTYMDASTKTDDTSKAIVNKLDKLFQDANIDTEPLKRQAREIQSFAMNSGEDTREAYSNALNRKAPEVGARFANSVMGNMKIEVSGDNVEVKDNGFWRIANKIKNKIKNNFGAMDFVANGNGGVQLRASGGPVDEGQLFVAREAGPELVGRIGSQTAVANNDQIVQAVSQGVASAVSRVLPKQNNGGSINVYLDGDQIRASVQRREYQYSNMMGI